MRWRKQVKGTGEGNCGPTKQKTAALETQDPPEAGFNLGCVRREVFRRDQQNLATGFNQSALPLPMAEETAGSEMRDVGGLGQLFIGDIQFDS